ncbi:MAG: class I SAM-dependent methyltransferase [Pseudonocardiaceae bacterium]
MPMNLIHRRICRSEKWANRMRSHVLPWACEGVRLDGDVLEIGPGYGAATRWLLARGGRLTAVEIDPGMAEDLRAEFGARVDVRGGDGAELPLPGAVFDAVVCFTMLHHVSSPERQDRLFTEVARVLRPGGAFAGSDSRLSLRFRLLHVGDTMVALDPITLPHRLHEAGLVDARTDVGGRSFRFRASRPPARP